MSYRVRVNEIDASSIVSSNTDEIGAMVIKARKGVYKYCQSEADVINTFGNPSADYPEVFEAIAFARTAPVHVRAAIHNDALYGGVDISISGVAGFGTGRDISTFSFDTYPDLSHVFFAASPYADDLRAKITYVSGKKFTLDLYKVVSTGYQLINTYNYSLIREKDNFGKSLYIMDVFNNNIYVIPKVNASFVYTNYNLSGLTADFSGGTRGTDPTVEDYTTAWNTFQAKAKYPAKIFMDCNGNSVSTINTIIQTYQPYGHGISVVPMGNDAAGAKTYRQGLGLDSSNVSLYTNWAKIRDDYNNSEAWISDVGSVGKKYAYMQDVYDAEAPAGVDENREYPHGGQLSSWTYLEVEQSYTDADLQTLDEAQINPILKDDNYGRMIYGNKTMQSTLSSTSFIGTRRLYNNILKAVTTQIVPPQMFRINDDAHRRKARLLTTNYLEPIAGLGYLNDYYVVCDLTNNTPETLNERKFILSIYLQATPDTEFYVVNAVYVGNNVQIQEIINGQ